MSLAVEISGHLADQLRAHKHLLASKRHLVPVMGEALEERGGRGDGWYFWDMELVLFLGSRKRNEISHEVAAPPQHILDHH
jgi:hypothetical protein